MNDRLASVLMQAWMKRGWLAGLLWPIALLYGVLLTLRCFLYKTGWLQQHALPVPVIIVGNIFIGGTGKTPLTLWLLQQLKSRGYHPGVISRGYGRTQDAPAVVTLSSLAVDAGDEAVLIAQQSGCPVAVGRNRFDAGTTLLDAFPDVDVIVADDGLQHLALARNIEIVLFDSRGVGNGWLLPAGPLREPADRKRDITVVNLNDAELISPALPSDTFRMQLEGTSAYPLNGAGQTQSLSSLAPGAKLVAAAGIGHPERFFSMLRRQGVPFTALPLPDHYRYDVNPFQNLDADLILITEKDAVKCRQIKQIADDHRIWVVSVAAHIEGAFMEKIVDRLKIARLQN